MAEIKIDTNSTDMLNMCLREYREYAKTLGKVETININELADEYCKASDEDDDYKKNVYFSAIIIRFWYKIHKLWSENPTLELDKETYYSWLVEAIEMACKKENRAWQTNPKLNAQQVINQTLATRFVAQAYYENNLQKNLGRQQMVALDEQIDGDEYRAARVDFIADETSEIEAKDNSLEIIQDYISKNKLVEAIILDTIITKKPFKYEKHKVTETSRSGETYTHMQNTTTFWPFKLVKELNALDTDYIEYFIEKYSVPRRAFEAAMTAITTATNQKKYKMIDATKEDLRLCLAWSKKVI